MLLHKNRLIKKEDFAQVYRGGKFFSCGDISVKVRQNGLDQTRVGVAVGLKFSKKAVERNRIKRQIREIFRKKIDGLEKGWDIVVMAKNSPGSVLTSEVIEKSADVILEKIGLVKKIKK